VSQHRDRIKILKPVWQDIVPVCFAGDGLLVVDPLSPVAVSVLKLEPEAAVTGAEELVEGVERVVEAAVLGVVMTLPEIGSIFGDAIVVIFLPPLGVTEQLVGAVDLDELSLGVFIL